MYQECSTFIVGDAIRTRMRNAELHTRGVFGSVCRHEFPLLFMDMKHVERYSFIPKILCVVVCNRVFLYVI